MNGCSITDEYTRRGIDTIHLENEHLRVEVLAGKGGDITEIRDKRTDTNLLFEAPHEWTAPSDGHITDADGAFAFLDHYPGGWQSVLPAAGGPSTCHGAPFPLHGESSLVPWDVTIVDAGRERVAVELDCSLTRYPLNITRKLVLTADQPRLTVSESVTNCGEVSVQYSWLQHIAFGPPLVGPSAQLDVPCRTVLVDPDHDVPNAMMPPGAQFNWPICNLDSGFDIDLREFPPKSDRVHDLVALTDFEAGRYTIRNPELLLAVDVRFPDDLFEFIWYWRAFGGFEGAPFFGRNYTAGLEPATSIPNAGLERAVENGTARMLAPGASESMTMSLETSSTIAEGAESS